MEGNYLTNVENVYVTANDIERIGNTMYKEEDGTLAIVCDSATASLEEIFLRSILKCFGEEYHITETEDFIWEDKDGNEVVDILFKTNLPKDKVF